MIPSFHAVFGLRHRDKSAKVIDYNDQVIRVREYLLFRGIPSPMYFLLSPDFTYEHFCEKAAEELLRVKDLEKRLEQYNLMAE